MRFWVVFVVVVVFGGIICGISARVSELGYCPAATITDAILGFPDSICDLHHSYNIAVIEVNLVHIIILFFLLYFPIFYKLFVKFKVQDCVFCELIFHPLGQILLGFSRC